MPRQAAVFWAVLGVAVLALVALIARLVRRPVEG
jgi:hypothetical protein